MHKKTRAKRPTWTSLTLLTVGCISPLNDDTCCRTCPRVIEDSFCKAQTSVVDFVPDVTHGVDVEGMQQLCRFMQYPAPNTIQTQLLVKTEDADGMVRFYFNNQRAQSKLQPNLAWTRLAADPLCMQSSDVRFVDAVKAQGHSSCIASAGYMTHLLTSWCTSSNPTCTQKHAFAQGRPHASISILKMKTYVVALQCGVLVRSFLQKTLPTTLHTLQSSPKCCRPEYQCALMMAYRKIAIVHTFITMTRIVTTSRGTSSRANEK